LRVRPFARALVFAATLALSGHAQALDLRQQSKLLLTGGVSTIEGAGGGGLSTWAVTTGYGAAEGIGGNVHATIVKLPDYELRSWGAAVGLFDRLELSYARQAFDTENAGAALGLGAGFKFNQDIWGAKAFVVGDAIYDQDRLLPQVAVGVQLKKNDKGAIVRAVGGTSDEGADYYIAATKLLLAQSLLLNGTVRSTEANQLGLLGFGGPKGGRSVQVEGSVAWLASKRLAFGAEYRSKPSNLAFAREQDAYDLFAAYALNKNLSVTAAYVDLGDIATFKNQRGLYLSLQAGF
jgi:hypothetical protein